MIVKGLDLSHYINESRNGEREREKESTAEGKRERHVDIIGSDAPFCLVT